MITALILAQTVFYITVSTAIIAVGVFCGVVAYHLIHITRELEGLSHNLHKASGEAGERINDILDRLSDLSILSYFLKKGRRSHFKK
ncbi:hypothetical protein A2662_03720 [Candidatus Giovannonibacteria bacterium RIFCSPHIGHO2_01_FULL_45_33]|uniref:Uncharacterized protein n=1 Tax=Candidatus Giovannonibacteria bacterium RIFCSPLOWO2_01_FULL_45_34 TaxID=1798351 RepID=A0A1F5X029_9BACT|nr:MAG: hypothetical protein A2662_03720 [Candidatus Giovannonibacteria bacterium RIFCSPHIGHO2_01_FULL_45_33]OGF68806.1 MAG: hypothetical protein A3C73_01945 [Candidatus Giovannonibacteria bacterium RIFCSPHIGHO2_02_FULL_44_11]OGF81213.1 MAG: hypothetical protein A2930_01985 [Candidatus Giovannonibacteria bacterium RIFCSPLOWO2_01_FULL_45_34]